MLFAMQAWHEPHSIGAGAGVGTGVLDGAGVGACPKTNTGRASGVAQDCLERARMHELEEGSGACAMRYTRKHALRVAAEVARACIFRPLASQSVQQHTHFAVPDSR